MSDGKHVSEAWLRKNSNMDFTGIDLERKLRKLSAEDLAKVKAFVDSLDDEASRLSGNSK